ncbi:MAG: CDP-glycerol glycerophosphotransferase family protein, partial [bacterium]|nr:CDP-glycerol glycerophosphotransferase family protein [bacterium]
TRDQIHIVGSPRLDYFYREDKIPSREKLFQYLGLDPAKKLVHIATVELYDISYVVKILASARDSGKIKAPLEIYCSVHPGGDIAKHEWYAKKYNLKLRYSFGRRDDAPNSNFRYNPTEEEMYMLTSLWQNSDLMINFSSTAAIESMLGDTPTINVMFGKPWDWLAWRKSAVYRDFQEHYKDITAEHGTKVVKNKKQLLEAVNLYLTNPEIDCENRRETCQKMITFLDGKCSQRVFRHIIAKISC